jgi:hypothetical protein
MDYRGLSALVIAGSLGLGLVIGIAGHVWTGTPLTEQGGEALVAIGGALVGAIAGYIAGRRSEDNGNGNGKSQASEKPPE